MNNIINKIISTENNKKILIYGDIVIDIYNYTNTKRISSESPIPVFEYLNEPTIILGGAGNVLNNILVLNRNTHLLTIIEDKYKESIILSENLININDINYKNIIKTRYLSDNQQCFRVDTPNNYIMSESVITKFKNKIDNIISDYDIIIISDYNTGIINADIVKYIIDEANKLDITTMVDPKNKYDIYKNCKIIKSNKYDAEKFSNKTITTINDAYNICDIFLTTLNIKECIITLSEKGCVYKNIYQEQLYIPCTINKCCEILDVTGAGDTFISTFAIGILNKLNIEEKLLLCNLFCSDIITRRYVSCVNMLNIFKTHYVIFNEYNCNILKKYLNNQKIIFTTGCFDLLHEGHIETFKKAKELGDILIVALNDDNSIKKIKGNSRPINNLNTRLSILSSIKYIDFIIIFSEDTPNNIYNIIQPDILVKGGDYSLEQITTIFPNITNFISIPLINSISTTNIIKKINSV